jgi:hypothetical protein
MCYILVYQKNKFSCDVIILGKSLFCPLLDRPNSGQFSETTTAIDNLNVLIKQFEKKVIKSLIES